VHFTERRFIKDFSGMIVVADTAPLNDLIQIDCEAIVHCNHGFTADLSTALRSGRDDKVSYAIDLCAFP
jgi:hypothetical protein